MLPIGEWIERFGKAAEKVAKRSPIDPRALPTYSICLFLFVGVVIAIATTPFFLGKNGAAIGLGFFGALAACGILAHRYNFTLVANLLSGFALIHIAGTLIVASSAILTAASWPLADTALAKADLLMGFFWPDHLRWYAENQIAFTIAHWAYVSFHLQIPLLVILLFALRYESEGWSFVNAFALTGLATLAIYPFVPAAGPYVHFAIAPDS